VPDKLEVRVSADQRYKLYVGRTLVSFGPQRGDLEHWFYETVDLAPYLKPGENLVWALVWNFGWLAPVAQMTMRTAFLCDAPDHEELSTPGAWQISRVHGWDFQTMDRAGHDYFSSIGPGEIWTASPVADYLSLPVNPNVDWRTPHEVRGALPRGATYDPIWCLVPRSIPAMRYEKREKRPVFRRGYVGDATDIARVDGSAAIGPIEVCSGRPCLLDYQQLVCAYPQLTASGPAGSVITLTYGEALWRNDPKDGKGNRNEVSGKEPHGYQDKIVLGEGECRFEPLWWRTFRYLFIESSAPVQVSIDATETGYPYKVESSFEADDPHVAPIWDVAVRTAKRCAGETFFDCPYYEQLQYAGDTRIQALISYYLGRDRALARNAVEQFSWSVMDTGLTQSRYPNQITQVIPPFSLWWLLMRHDNWLYDAPSEKHKLPDTFYTSILSAMNELRSTHPEEGGVFWNFADWVPQWNFGIPPGGPNSSIHRLCEALVTACAAKQYENLLRERNPGLAASLVKGFLKSAEQTLERCRQGEDGLLQARWEAWEDKPEPPSEHAEALYRVALMELDRPVPPWPTAALERANAAKTTYYFSYYKHLAMQPEDYLAQLGPWKQMIEDGLTTFAENPPPVRSDCHAWSAHPILGFFQLIAGVTSTAPGWSHARIAPKPGALKRFDAKIAHPAGELRVLWEGGKVSVDTPVPAEFVWRGKTERLSAGRHRFDS
jgi:hypothetical protein